MARVACPAPLSLCCSSAPGAAPAHDAADTAEHVRPIHARNCGVSAGREGHKGADGDSAGCQCCARRLSALLFPFLAPRFIFLPSRWPCRTMRLRHRPQRLRSRHRVARTRGRDARCGRIALRCWIARRPRSRVLLRAWRAHSCGEGEAVRVLLLLLLLLPQLSLAFHPSASPTLARPPRLSSVAHPPSLSPSHPSTPRARACRRAEQPRSTASHAEFLQEQLEGAQGAQGAAQVVAVLVGRAVADAGAGLRPPARRRRARD